jgi:glycosyltransferase involved in cell wall biosynthesis
MKLIIVTPYFYPSLGGVQNYVLNIARGLNKEYGHSIVIITSGSKENEIKKRRFEGMTVYELPYQFKLSNTPISFKWKKQIEKIISSEKPDIINAHTPVPFIADIAERASKNVPFILTYHNDLVKVSAFGSFLAKFYNITITNKTLRQSNAIISTSKYYSERSRYLKKWQAKVDIVSPGVDVERFNTKVNKTWLKEKHPGKKLVLFVGSMQQTHAHKGVDVLIRAIAQSRKQVNTIQLILAGTGNAMPIYKELTISLGVDDIVKFPGMVTEKDLAKYYAGADVFVLPSTNESEGFGMVLAEAMACGTPVIGSKVGGIPSLINDRKTGLLVKPASPTELSKTIIKVLTNTNLHNKLSDNANKYILNQLDWRIPLKATNDSLLKLSCPRIFHVVAKYPPSLGGMEKVVETLANAQAKKGWYVSVLTSRLNFNHKEYEKPTQHFSVTRLKSIEIAHTPIIPGLFFKLLKLKKNEVTHLHIAQAYVPEIVWAASQIKGFKYIAQIHLDVSQSGKAGFLLKLYKPFILGHVLRSASFVVVFTEDQKQDVNKKYGVNLDKIQIIANGVEDKFFYSKKKALHKPPRLLFVGRLNIQKNVQQLLWALNGISERFKTNVVGEGELGNELKRLSSDLKLKDVNFLGRKDNEELLKLYKESDIFVLTSKLEGMPLVLLEAMAMGLPIIATNVGGIRNVVKANNGFLVPLDDVVALRAALLKFEGKKELYERMSKQSYASAKNYKWGDVVVKFQQLYEEAADG